MNRNTFARALIVICMLGFAISVYGQDKDKTEIIYTGKFLGYARVPSLQTHAVDLTKPRCPKISPDKDSEAAIKFLEERLDPSHWNAILLGTGDNFSPELEARILDQAPPQDSKQYAVGNKELYFSDGDKWYFYKNLPKTVEKTINEGLGTIPTDNVGCFMRAAGFNAIVPGKHDFYFGAERVRALARFLARPQKEDGYQSVQMLGANLVLQTGPITPNPIPPTLKEKPWFNPEWSKTYPVMNLKDGATVYPWFSYVKIKIGQLPDDPDTREALVVKLKKPSGGIDKTELTKIIQSLMGSASASGKKQLTELLSSAQSFPDKPIHVCPSTKDGNPNQIPTNVTTDCEPLDMDKGKFRLVDSTVAYFLEMKELKTNDKLAFRVQIDPGKPIVGDKRHFSTLITGKNYALCSVIGASKDPKIPPPTNCLRFSVHTPLFYFPHVLPLEQGANNYTDPDPYVYIDGRAAIFGIVEPLGSQVGILNFGWKNLSEEGLTSKVSVEDPAVALRQQLDYFERLHPDFNDLKILLAQTSPQRAKILATKFPEFQVVVSAADLEQATSELDLRTTWKSDGNAGSLIAVPAPYFDQQARKGFVHFGMINAEKSANGDVVLSTKSLKPAPITVKEDTAQSFWNEIQKLTNCSNSRPGKPPGNQEFLKLLVLCTMREQLSADVAMIQSRDLFDQLPLVNDPNDPVTSSRMLKRPYIPTAKAPANAENFQQMLDRLVWKGDLLTLLYVPGEALKKALDMSAALEAEENATLSLVLDRGRKLETLGVTKDKVTDEYIINELPLDTKKIYAVATTDFIGAGDTGYPDLAKAALNPRTHPAAFPEKLLSISSLVCRKLFPDRATADLYCLDAVESAKYLDETMAKKTEPQRQPSAFQRFVDGLPFKGPNKNVVPETIGAAVEQKVQRRPIWMLSLKDFSFAFNSLNNNFTDKELKENFSGNPTSGVQAKHSKDFRIGLDVKFWRSSHRRDFYIEPGIDYKRQTTGDTPETVQVSQISNRLFSDTGFVLWRKPGRPVPNFGFNVSVHAETQLQRPFSNFTLDNKENLKISQERSMTVLPRFGIRWQNREHFAEFGFQGGKEFDAFRGYEFDTAGGPMQCVVNPEQSIDDCISESSKLADGIRKDTPVRVSLEDRPRAGLYWKTNFSVPFGPRVKYTLDDEADFLFVNFSRDTSLDTRFRDISKHSLSFSIFPSISIGPTLRLLLYQNKGTERHFLIQKEFGIETKISFDIFNRRETGVQFKNKSK